MLSNFYSLVTFKKPLGRKRHPELLPVMPSTRDTLTSPNNVSNNRLSRDTSMTGKKGMGFVSAVTTPTTVDGLQKVPRRAVSMTRLHQLAQPRQRYLEETIRWRAERLGNADPMAASMTQSLMGSHAVCSSRKKPEEDPMIRSMNESILKSASSSNVKTTPFSGVKMRGSEGKKPRPLSIHGSSMATPTITSPSSLVKKKPERRARPLSMNFSPASSTVTSGRTPTSSQNTPRTANHQHSSSSSTISSGKDSTLVTPKSKPIENSLTNGKAKSASKARQTDSSSRKNSRPDTSSPSVNASFESEKAVKEAEEQKKAEFRKKREEKRREEEIRRKEEEERIRLEKERIELEHIQEQERLRQEEYERIQREEEEALRLEEEQKKLGEQLKQLEEEKLRKAIEEQQKRQEEERRKVEERNRQRIEREEQEMKAREEAEKARLELDERLRKDEEERIERKKVNLFPFSYTD